MTIAKRPSGRQDGEGYATDLGEARNEKFFAKGLDRIFARQPVGQITLAATTNSDMHSSCHTPRMRGIQYAAASR